MLWPTPQAFDATDIKRTTPEAVELQLRRGDPNGCRRSSTGNLREDVLMASSSPQASHAKTSPTQEREPDWKVNAADCSLRLLDSFAIYDPIGYCSKTSQLSAPEEPTLFAGRWPRWATGGPTAAFELAMSAHLTAAIDGGVSRGPRSEKKPTDSEGNDLPTLF
jgi:hypothetical protein